MIFYSLVKPTLNEKGEKEMDVLTPSQALQIAGRAGRYRTHFEDGEVTTFRREDLTLLKDVTSRIIEPIEVSSLLVFVMNLSFKGIFLSDSQFC